MNILRILPDLLTSSVCVALKLENSFALAGTDPSKCTAEGPGLVDGIKDTFPAKFKVQARDRDGNPIHEGGDDFKVKITDPDGQDVPAEISDNGDGTYDVVYHPDKPGPHKGMLSDYYSYDCKLQYNITWH